MCEKENAQVQMKQIDRPMPGVPFEYYFYVKPEDRFARQNTKELLASLQTICGTMQILGDI